MAANRRLPDYLRIYFTYFLSSNRLYLLPKSAATNMAVYTARSPKAFRVGGWVSYKIKSSNRFKALLTSQFPTHNYP